MSTHEVKLRVQHTTRYGPQGEKVRVFAEIVGRVTLAEIMAKVQEVDPLITDPAQVGLNGTLVWMRAPTAEEDAERKAWRDGADERRESYDRREYERLKSKYEGSEVPNAD